MTEPTEPKTKTKLSDWFFMYAQNIAELTTPALDHEGKFCGTCWWYRGVALGVVVGVVISYLFSLIVT